MISELGGVTSRAIELALDGLSLRHNAIASNIANANTVGYRPMKVEFESKVSEILATQNSNSAWPTVSRAEPQIFFDAPQGTASMNFEMNTVMLNQNVLQYQTLIKGLNVYMGIAAEAIKEGKR
jgi:flagellar basal-body rod protein FlgB